MTKKATDVTDWWISFKNGNDANGGLRPTAPLKTFGELFERWESSSPIFSIPSITIHIFDQDINDALVNQLNCYGTLITVVAAESALIEESGTFTAVTPKNIAARTPPKIAKASGTWKANSRIRLTSGSNKGAIAWVNLDEGGGVARITDFAQPSDFFTSLTASIGDSYVIETLTDFFIGDINVSGNVLGKKSLNGGLVVRGMNVLAAANSLIGVTGNLGLTLDCSRIHADGALIMTEASKLTRYNSYVDDTELLYQGASTGASYMGGGRGTSNNLVLIEGSSILVSDFIGQNYAHCVAEDSYLTYDGPLANFDAVPSTLNPHGDGIVIGAAHDGGYGYGGQSSASDNGQLWGAGNAGVGASLVFNADLIVNSLFPPSITGALGDYRMGLAVSELNATSYDPATYTQGAVLPCTWANLLAPFGVTGLGGSAHNPNKNTHIYTFST